MTNGHRVLRTLDFRDFHAVTVFESEFDLWLLSLVQKDWDKIARTAQAAREEIGRHLEVKLTGLGMNRYHIVEAVENTGLDPYKSILWSDDDISMFVTQLRKASKPIIVAFIPDPHILLTVVQPTASGMPAPIDA